MRFKRIMKIKIQLEKDFDPHCISTYTRAKNEYNSGTDLLRYYTYSVQTIVFITNYD